MNKWDHKPIEGRVFAQGWERIEGTGILKGHLLDGEAVYQVCTQSPIGPYVKYYGTLMEALSQANREMLGLPPNEAYRVATEE